MTVLGRLAVTTLFPMVFAGFICLCYLIDEKWYRRPPYLYEIFLVGLGLEAFFALLAVWGVR